MLIKSDVSHRFEIKSIRKSISISHKASTYRSLSSAAWEASDNLAVADPRRSSERSRSSSSNWMRRFKAATSDSA